MTRDETVALFLQGREAWNAWAETMLADRKAMEAASADFSRCLFLVRGAEGTSEAAGEADKEEFADELAAKSMILGGDKIDFGGLIFPGDADFESATFRGNADFRGAIFTGHADFRSAAFTVNADFSANFERDANFGSATFQRDACFWSAIFEGDAKFRSATFEGYAGFPSATFERDANFESATFEGDANFRSATFNRHADFRGATFKGNAYFPSATFRGDAFFRRQTFANDAFFNGAKFGPQSRANFGLATFERVAQFDGAVFEGEADFNAVWGKRSFSMAQAHFKGVPYFIQAHFEEAPRLDNVVVEERLLEPQEYEPEEGKMLPRLHRWLKACSARYRRVTGGIAQGSALRDMPARWRVLKRLAIEGHDTERELQFFSGEIRSKRFAEHWPLPWPVWKLRTWGGTLGFWAGLLYQMFSNFGRSLARPFAAWLLCIVIFAIYFLGQNEAMKLRRDRHFGGLFSVSMEYTRTALRAFRSPPYCYPGNPPYSAAPKEEGFSGLVEKARASTDLVNEAFSIAYRNAAIVLDSSGDSGRRAFGCLYGVERYGDTPVAFVPRNVAIASGIQKLLSAIFVFLFGLAVRNMLKVK